MNRDLVDTSLSSKIEKEYHIEEVNLLELFLKEINVYNPDLTYSVIEPVLGLEIFHRKNKITELYCAEYRDNTSTTELQVHCHKNWEKPEILNVKEAAIYVCK